MPCAFCGEGDRWIKTCRTKDGSHLRVCDPCYEVLRSWLVIVPGDGVVTARCDACGAYFNPREMAEVSPGGRHDAYAGTCGVCAKEGTEAPSRRSRRYEEERLKKRKKPKKRSKNGRKSGRRKEIDRTNRPDR